MSLTPKESAFCHFLADYQTRTGLAPTYREIAEHLGLRALGSVQQYVRQLTAKGYLAVEGKGRARALKLVRSATGEGQIWLLGRVAAGAPIEPGSIVACAGVLRGRYAIIAAHWRCLWQNHPPLERKAGPARAPRAGEKARPSGRVRLDRP